MPNGLLLFTVHHPACYHDNYSNQELKMHISLRGPIVTILLLCGLMSSPVRAGEVSVAVA
jgi:hypothetical protein